jgi:5-(carboxyamino)imidazole ribonucleotide synthase
MSRGSHPARIGILGGGQLGRMIALAAIPMGHRCTVLDPAEAPPTAAVARHLRAPYDDEAALRNLAAASDVVTWEFENVSATPLARLAEAGVPVLPGPRSLEHKVDRLDEKLFFRGLGIPTAEFAPATTRAEFDAALAQVGLPVVVKTRRYGYDGKGQAHIEIAADIDDAWARVGGAPLIVEKKIPFDRELSILGVRSADGDVRFWPLVENVHRGGILRRSTAPMERDSPELEALADDFIRRLLEATDHVGVLALELFQVGGALLANEMAPRVHNSGHWTIEGAVTSQFENHVRAITGAPLGDTAARGPCVLINLIGTLPDRAAVLAIPGAHWHDYGKSASPGRKLGHVTILAESREELAERVGRVEELVTPSIPEGVD